MTYQVGGAFRLFSVPWPRRSTRYCQKQTTCTSGTRGRMGRCGPDLPGTTKGLAFRLGAEAVVAVIDADDTPVHLLEHEQAGRADPLCRLCTFQRISAETLVQLGERPYYPRLKVAFGVPVPAIEAWYLCGREPHNTEMEWTRKLMVSALTTSRNQLKLAIYGTDRPSLTQATEYATAAARRLVHELTELERDFPGGFGTLARAIRSW